MYMNMAFDNVCFKGSIVSPSARFVYMCLCKHADSTMQTCFPSLSRIAEIVGKSISTVKRAVRELCKYGAIERNPRFRKDGGQTSNLYKVAQVDFGSLLIVPNNSANEETGLELKENQDMASESISFSESNLVVEPARACATIDSEIDHENNQIEESFDTETRSTNRFNTLNILKKTVVKFAKTILTKMQLYKIHSFRHNGLGGGHR